MIFFAFKKHVVLIGEFPICFYIKDVFFILYFFFPAQICVLYKSQNTTVDEGFVCLHFEYRDFSLGQITKVKV